MVCTLRSGKWSSQNLQTTSIRITSATLGLKAPWPQVKDGASGRNQGSRQESDSTCLIGLLSLTTVCEPVQPPPPTVQRSHLWKGWRHTRLPVSPRAPSVSNRFQDWGRARLHRRRREAPSRWEMILWKRGEMLSQSALIPQPRTSAEREMPSGSVVPQQKRGEYSMKSDATGTSQGTQHRYTEATIRKDTYGKRVGPRWWVFMGAAMDL